MLAPLQGVCPASRGAPGPVIQAGRADGHEAADLRAEELEQRHVPAAGRGGQAPRLHRPHLQPDAVDRHVDGLSEDGKEPWVEGGWCSGITTPGVTHMG